MFHPRQTIKAIETIVRQQLKTDATGHDHFHVFRVRDTAKYIASQEGSQLDTFVLQASALLHDIADYKFHDGDSAVGYKTARRILKDLQVPQPTIKAICHIIKYISFSQTLSSKGNQITSLEGFIVQDADRLDALGAIGIARAFSYGGHKSIPLHDPSIPKATHQSFQHYKNHPTTQINHFCEKLLLLKDKMNTQTGRELASQRHQFMLDFLNQFYSQWRGEK